MLSNGDEEKFCNIEEEEEGDNLDKSESDVKSEFAAKKNENMCYNESNHLSLPDQDEYFESRMNEFSGSKSSLSSTSTSMKASKQDSTSSQSSNSSCSLYSSKPSVFHKHETSI